MNISLTPVLEDMVKAKVESGYYNNASEVIRETLRLMDTNEQLIAQVKLNLQQKSLAEGMEDITAGNSRNLSTATDIGQFFDDIRREGTE